MREALFAAVPLGRRTMPCILSEVGEATGTITLHHERHRNALSQPLVEEVVAALHICREARARVMVLRAKPGDRV